MIEEKGIMNDAIEVEVGGMKHFMEVENVVEMIQQASENEIQQIKGILSRIDFQNGNIKHFLEHLAKGFIVNNM